MVMAMRSLDSIEKAWKKKRVPRFDVGDSVEVHVKITEGEKDRVQIFSGTVIGRKHQGLGETFTVRRIVQGEGVERVFPIHSPRVVNVVVKKRGRVRRAKLNYLRERVGRATKVREKIGAEIPKDEPIAEEPAPQPEPPKQEEPPKEEKAEQKKEEPKAEEPASK